MATAPATAGQRHRVNNENGAVRVDQVYNLHPAVALAPSANEAFYAVALRESASGMVYNLLGLARATAVLLDFFDVPFYPTEVVKHEIDYIIKSSPVKIFVWEFPSCSSHAAGNWPPNALPVGVLNISPTGGWSRMDMDGF